MSSCPHVPNDHVVPTVGPGHHEQAQGVLIVNVHAIFVHASLNCAAGGAPRLKTGSGIWISRDHSVQDFAGANSGHGH